jgi:hypothetical protein
VLLSFFVSSRLRVIKRGKRESSILWYYFTRRKTPAFA